MVKMFLFLTYKFMKKLILVLVVLFTSTFTAVDAYNSTYNTCDNSETTYSYDYYANWETVKKYAYDTNSRNSLKVCFYTEDWKKLVLQNWETKVLEEKVNNRINYEKILCDNWVTKSIFKWTKTIKMACNFTVNWRKYVLLDSQSRVITTKYYNNTISQKFKCDNWKITKIAEWSNNQIWKKSCNFVYNNKVYKLDHNWYTTIKTYENDHLVYKKYVCDNWNIKEYSLWRNTFNDNSGRELTQNCRFVYRGKYYDLQDNWVKKFTTTIYSNWTKNVYTRTYYCENWIAKIY